MIKGEKHTIHLKYPYTACIKNSTSVCGRNKADHKK